MPALLNHSREDTCARAFRHQHLLAPYQQLLKDTANWLDPQPGERWLDLGCGSGQLSRTLWLRSGGTLAEVIGLDCAAANERAFSELRAKLQPTPSAENWRFVAADFSTGLDGWSAGHFDGIVSGLAIQYAESYSEQERRWTTDAYDHVLKESARLLRPGGRFVFSVNVPEPSWGRIALGALPGAFRQRNPLRYLLKAWRMLRYGGWLRQEARKGRFHYLPLATIRAHLTDAGFVGVEHRHSFARQAYVLRAWKPLDKTSQGKAP